MGQEVYIELPGDENHELPPLLVHPAPLAGEFDDIVEVAAGMVDAEEMIPAAVAERQGEEQLERRKHDLAVHLSDRYKTLVSQWLWGDSILEWIRQCEITFDSHQCLRSLLHPDVWPHASRSSFVHLLSDKGVSAQGAPVESAVGLRLTFRQPPPIDFFSNQFLILLNSSITYTAYQSWAGLSGQPAALLPPTRFHFQIHELN